jgi:hypothetical protein
MPRTPIVALRNGGDALWEADAKVGRVKAYLVGSPYATDFGFSDCLPRGPLQVRLSKTLLNHLFMGIAHPSRICLSMSP